MNDIQRKIMWYESKHIIKNEDGHVAYLNAHQEEATAHRIIDCWNGCIGLNPKEIWNSINCASLALNALVDANKHSLRYNHEIRILTKAIDRIGLR